MKTRQMAFLAASCAMALVTVTSPLAQRGSAPATPNIFHLPYNPAAVPQGPARMYNTAKAKLMAGGKIVGITVYSPDPTMYCAMANAGYDFTWIEMQHSPLTYEDVARMLYACKGATAMPFIRVPDATEENIQKATDIGALGRTSSLGKAARRHHPMEIDIRLRGNQVTPALIRYAEAVDLLEHPRAIRIKWLARTFGRA